jgi:hypothetical protein
MSAEIDIESTQQMLIGLLQPWNNSLLDPPSAQNEVLQKLVTDFSKTVYGKQKGADQLDNINDFRRVFPIATYEEYRPWIKKVMSGDTGQLLCEEPAGWAITRGTTKGESKFIPMTPTDMRLRISAGRAVMNYIADHEKFEIFSGANLNLNFPSNVGTISAGEQEIEYGYSSGIYTKFVSKFTPIRSVPSQEEIDVLGGGKSIEDWERRFELAYQKCKDEHVTLVGGVLPTAQRFARYLRKAHKVYPKDIWDIQIVTLGSVPGINTRYQPSLNALYGDVVIREIYGATEGMFGQQRDAKRAWVPNYDLFFFEVETRSGIKMMYEMEPGEMGSLIVSTPIFPRYRIGDLIRAFEPPYFRCIGRDRRSTMFRYVWDEVLSLNFDQL